CEGSASMRVRMLRALPLIPEIAANPKTSMSSGRLRAAHETVEHVWPQRVTRRQPGMVEAARAVMAHPQPLHDPPRPLVGRRGEGDDLDEFETLEGEAEGCSGGLGGVTTAPVIPGQAPSNLDPLGGRQVGGLVRVADDSTDSGSVV